MVDHKDIELAQVKVIKTALRKGKKYDNLVKNYGDYLKKLRAEKNPNDYVKDTRSQDASQRRSISIYSKDRKLNYMSFIII